MNTRTKGELEWFVSNIYKIGSENRTPEIWAPFDAIEKAFEASPTLKQYPKLLKCIEKSSWVGGNIHKNPISEDFLTWVMRDALVEADMWKSEEQVQQLFKKINEELEQAFKNGTLKTDEKIQLISSMGGRSLKEMFLMGISLSYTISIGWFSFIKMLLFYEIYGKTNFRLNGRCNE